ncbi:15152_t:CDS:2 [Dentiscutata erythropus]|uniref:15152_t:CDS:1 n=1 Tax=Dentiscutata erythropus TaxID=1348616 RepID=A0A9N9D2E9_9GLOM|nr:15152_t:CDS:2 [Dentiscutata erythropus]
MEILQNIKTHYDNRTLVDTKIIVDENDSCKEIYVHSQILMIQSKYFSNALSKKWAHKENDYYIIRKPNATKESMDNILKYLYCGEQYISQGVKEFINTILLADEMSKNFQNIPIKHLKLIISQDNLNITELQILYKVILWLENKDWDEYSNIINCIRFDQITDDDFIDLRMKVRKNQISESIFKKVSDNYTKSKTKLNFICYSNINIDSNIICKEQLMKLMQWIDREETTNCRYKFNLLLREITNKAKEFYSFCDNKGATIVIGKRGKNSFIGGYNPLSWSSNYTYKSTKDSFIFSKDNKDIRLGRIISDFAYAIYCNPEFGPSFNRYEFYIPDNSNN